jgi:hypothetical protein
MKVGPRSEPLISCFDFRFKVDMKKEAGQEQEGTATREQN